MCRLPRNVRGGVLVCAVFAGLAIAPLAFAQEQPNEAARPKETQNEPSLVWAYINFAILVGLLGYMIYKNAPAFYRGRTESIQQGITEAAKAKREGEEKVADMERRIAGLGAEIESMRTNMRGEMAQEGERIRQETERHLRRIQQQAEQEIDMMGKTARRELQVYAAELALKSAQEQLPGRMNREVEDRLVHSFIKDLANGASRSTHTG